MKKGQGIVCKTHVQTHTHRDTEHICMGVLNMKGFCSNSGAKDEVNLMKTSVAVFTVF